MSLLTDKDQMAWHGPLRKMLQHHGITKHGDTVIEADILETVKPLIEAAVLQKLATVSVEPCAWEVETEQQDGTRAKWVSTDRKRHREFCDFGEPRQLYSQEAIAAARVQALEDAANRLRDLVLEHPRNAAETALQCEAAIRALIGGLNV